jgi:hypothetical protein
MPLSPGRASPTWDYESLTTTGDSEKARVGGKPIGVTVREGRGSYSMQLNRFAAVRKE